MRSSIPGLTGVPPCSRRALAEHQLLHDKGRAVQGLKRLLWLQHALGAVHTASSREIPLPSAGWDVQKSRDPSDSNSSEGGEASSLVRTPASSQLLGPMEAQGLLPLKLDGRIPEGNWNPQRLFEPL
ncbi:parathyroid hormone 4-like [Passer montanus]|uniref:parathyroid hormone 4-like n=1 Tax=Passer montanus TaxID=9160 RepID=UPI001961EDD9|nr:parathyroid hormone 4-like [Passer montanus]